MSKSDERRLDKITQSLSPKEAVLLWMAEAHEYSSIQTYCESLKDAPDSAFPLTRLGNQMEAAVRASMKGSGKKEPEVWHAIRMSVRDAAFLYYVIVQVNWRALEKRREHWLDIALCSTKLTLYSEWESTRRLALWWDQTCQVVAGAYVQHQTVQEVGRRYFDGRNPLFPELAANVEGQLHDAERLVEQYNDMFTGMAKPGSRRGKRAQEDHWPVPIDLAQVREQAQPSIRENVALFVDLAKAEALTLIGERDRGLDLVTPHVWPRGGDSSPAD